MGDLAITFSVVPWSDRAADDLRLIADVTERDISVFRWAVANAEMQLWAVWEDGARIGSVIWSVEREPDGITIVINAAAVYARNGGAFDAIWAAFIGLGRAIRARTVTCWTERAGLARLLERRGASFKYVAQVKL